MWGGTWYDFMGECDLVLLKGQMASKDVNIHIRTKIRYDYSFIETAAIQFGDDVLEVSSWGRYSLNGIDHADLSQQDSLSVEHSKTNDKEDVFTIKLPKGQNIVVKSFKDMVSVQPKLAIPSAQGLLGEYGTNNMLARDGKTILEDPNAFGQEWQVREDEPHLFSTMRAPQHPHAKCTMPDASAKVTRRRLGETVARAAAEAACEHWGEQKELCMTDVMKTGDLDYANAGPHVF